MISDEAVLAAAKVLYADKISNHAGDNAPQIIDACEKVARKALEAAAPYVLAQGWDGAATYVRNDMEINQRIYVMKRIKAANPYRSQA